ncbi:MAG: SH3 domain-containing protein [Anaerolineae bacterium]
MNAISHALRQSGFAIVALICLFLIGAIVVSAQTAPTPITIGENQIGTITDTTEGVQFSLSAAAPTSVEIQVLAISPGFAPMFRILDPTGIVVLDATGSSTQTIATGVPNLSSPGSYTIEVSSANGTPGQFLISVQPGTPLAPPPPLVLGETRSGSVDSDETREAYAFSASESEILLLTVRADDPKTGVVVALRDADDGETFGLSNAQLGGVRYRILMGQTNYLLEVMYSGGGSEQSFVVCLETESESITCSSGADSATATPIPPVQTEEAAASPVPTATINPNGTCMVSSAGGVSINVRSGPGTGYGIVGNLPPGSSAPVLGRLADNSWYQVNVGGVVGWVSASVVTTSGNCGGVPPVAAPAPPPTNASTSTQAPTLTLTPTSASSNLTPTVTNTPLATPTSGGTILPPTLPILEPLDTRPDLQYRPGGIALRRDTQGVPVEPRHYDLWTYVQNRGLSDATAFVVRICMNTFCYDKIVAGVAVNQEAVVAVELSPEVMGDVVLQIAIDFHNDVDESSESNNLVTFQMHLDPNG